MPDIITDFPALKRAAIGLRNTFPKDEVKPVRERPETLASYCRPAKVENLAVPFEASGNRQVLTALQVVEQPWLLDFINRFPNCFEQDVNADLWVFYPDGDAPAKPVQERSETLASYLAQMASDRAQWEKYLEKYVAPLKDGA